MARSIARKAMAIAARLRKRSEALCCAVFSSSMDSRIWSATSCASMVPPTLCFSHPLLCHGVWCTEFDPSCQVGHHYGRKQPRLHEGSSEEITMPYALAHSIVKGLDCS